MAWRRAQRVWVRAIAALAAPAGALLMAACSGGGGGGAGGSGGCPSDLPPSCPSGAAKYDSTIAPLLKAKCDLCHVPGGLSTPYLQTYDEVYTARSAVLDQVYACKMPPLGYPPLSTTERVELLGWLVCGAPDD
jgi:hypothetical protein